MPFLHFLSNMLKAKRRRRRLKSKKLSRLPVELIRLPVELLPVEMIPDILSRLPVEQLLQMRCCNKSFRDLIDDPYFRKHYDDRVIIHSSSATTTTDTVSFFTLIQLNEEMDCEFHFGEYNETSNEYKLTQPVTYPRILDHTGTGDGRSIIVGSCNGLVCLADRHRVCFDPIYIFNPVTREQLKLPPCRLVSEGLVDVVSGFGYHPVTKEYKVVRIQCVSKGCVKEVEVYTLGTGVWRSIGVPSVFDNFSFRFVWGLSSGVLVNGALHWINQLNILSFDLKTEDFTSIPIPIPSLLDIVDISALTQRLCLTHYLDSLGARVDIWSLNKDQSWTKEYNIAGTPLSSNDYALSGDSIYPITLTKSGKLLLWYNNQILVSYDPKNGERKIHGEYKAAYYNEIVVHVKSFVSLKALGEENAKITSSLTSFL